MIRKHLFMVYGLKSQPACRIEVFAGIETLNNNLIICLLNLSYSNFNHAMA
jgi:hypothetical protein